MQRPSWLSSSPSWVVANWGTVRDHIEARRFQITRDARTFEPLPERTTRTPLWEEEWLQFAAERMDCPVIVDSLEMPSFHVGCVSEKGIEEEALERKGWRVLEQRFPRKAFVVKGPSIPEDDSYRLLKEREGPITR